MDVKKSFAANLKTLREEAGLNQANLAEKLLVSRATISYYENCERVPDIEFLERTANYFNVSYDYLLGKNDKRVISAEEQAIRNSIGLSGKAILCLQTINEIKDRSETIAEIQNTINFLIKGLQCKEVTKEEIAQNIAMGISCPLDYPENAINDGFFDWNLSAVLYRITAYFNSTPTFFATEWAKHQKNNGFYDNLDISELIEEYYIDKIAHALKEAKNKYVNGLEEGCIYG